MSPVRNTHGKKMSAAIGSTTAQKTSMTMVRIIAVCSRSYRKATQRGVCVAVQLYPQYPEVERQFASGSRASIPVHSRCLGDAQKAATQIREEVLQLFDQTCVRLPPHLLAKSRRSLSGQLVPHRFRVLSVPQ